MKRMAAVLMALVMLSAVPALAESPDGLFASNQQVADSPEWIAAIPAAQEAELQRQFEQKEGERQKAEEAAHQARISLGETIALEARDALERNNTELALLLCLEFEREMPESEILQKTFADALKRRCAAGYVPITSEKSYKRTR